MTDPTVLIADDHPMVRDALGSALKTAFAGVRLLGAASLDETVAQLDGAEDVDLVLLDLDMPGMQGLIGLAALRSSHPQVPLVVVTAARDPALMRRAIELGASGFVPKSASLAEIAHVIETVMAGEIHVPPEAAESDPGDDLARRAAQLTQQQWRVLSLMAQGKLNKQIAYELGVGEPTVKAHVTTILRKLGVRSRTQAVIATRALGLEGIKPPGAEA